MPGSVPVLVAALLVSLCAGFVRGFAGFGYSALAEPGHFRAQVLNLLIVIASLALLRGLWGWQTP